MPSLQPSPVVPEQPLPQLSWRSFLFALAVTLAIFFGLHPLWLPMDMDAMDRNIAWSYAPIPLLVLVLLAVERKLRWATFLIETVRLTLVKFVLTFLVANILWAVVGPPAAASPLRASPLAVDATGRFEVRDAPPATPIDPALTGRLSGLVTDAGGAPLAGVFVAVTGGLDDVVFAPPPGGLVLTHDGSGLQPETAVVQVYEPLVLRGVAGAFHTVCAIDDAHRPLFNVPLVSAAERTLMFHRAMGRVSLTCSVHGHSDHVTELVVVTNPFGMWTGADGRFAFDGVPAADGARDGRLQITARGPTGAQAQLLVSLAPGDSLGDLRLSLR